MNIARRVLLRSAAFTAPALALAACTGTVTPAVIATVTAAASAAATAISGIVAVVQGMIVAGGVTGAALTQLDVLVSQMQAQVTILLTPVAPAAAPAVSSVFTIITGILAQAANYLPAILPIIALLGPRAGTALDTPAQAALRAHYEALRKIAAAA